MSADRQQDTPADRARALQAYICDRVPHLGLPEEPKDLLAEIRSHLVSATDDGLLRMKAHDVFKSLKLSRSPVDDGPDYVGIYGGEKDLKRTGERPHFLRRDGAWFHFTITVRRCAGAPLELVAYDFELCFPERFHQEERGARFVRFDLNPPDHRNEDRSLRCHTHPGHDDLIAPAPLMSPLDLLDLFVGGLALPERARKA